MEEKEQQQRDYGLLLKKVETVFTPEHLKEHFPEIAPKSQKDIRNLTQLRNALPRNNIEYMGQFLLVNKNELQDWGGAGKVTLNLLKTALKEMDIQIGEFSSHKDAKIQRQINSQKYLPRNSPADDLKVLLKNLMPEEAEYYEKNKNRAHTPHKDNNFTITLEFKQSTFPSELIQKAIRDPHVQHQILTAIYTEAANLEKAKKNNTAPSTKNKDPNTAPDPADNM